LAKKYPKFGKLLENQVFGMVVGALNYHHDYLIKDMRIVYKDGDCLSDKLNYGYKTVFAYLH
jgi:hypothetical protein